MVAIATLFAAHFAFAEVEVKYEVKETTEKEIVVLSFSQEVEYEATAESFPTRLSILIPDGKLAEGIPKTQERPGKLIRKIGAISVGKPKALRITLYIDLTRSLTPQDYQVEKISPTKVEIGVKKILKEEAPLEKPLVEKKFVVQKLNFERRVTTDIVEIPIEPFDGVDYTVVPAYYPDRIVVTIRNAVVAPALGIPPFKTLLAGNIVTGFSVKAFPDKKGPAVEITIQLKEGAPFSHRKQTETKRIMLEIGKPAIPVPPVTPPEILPPAPPIEEKPPAPPAPEEKPPAPPPEEKPPAPPPEEKPPAPPPEEKPPAPPPEEKPPAPPPEEKPPAPPPEEKPPAPPPEEKPPAPPSEEKPPAPPPEEKPPAPPPEEKPPAPPPEEKPPAPPPPVPAIRTTFELQDISFETTDEFEIVWLTFDQPIANKLDYVVATSYFPKHVYVVLRDTRLSSALGGLEGWEKQIGAEIVSRIKARFYMTDNLGITEVQIFITQERPIQYQVVEENKLQIQLLRPIAPRIERPPPPPEVKKPEEVKPPEKKPKEEIPKEEFPELEIKPGVYELPPPPEKKVKISDHPVVISTPGSMTVAEILINMAMDAGVAVVFDYTSLIGAGAGGAAGGAPGAGQLAGSILSRPYLHLPEMPFDDALDVIVHSTGLEYEVMRGPAGGPPIVIVGSRYRLQQAYGLAILDAVQINYMNPVALIQLIYALDLHPCFSSISVIGGFGGGGFGGGGFGGFGGFGGGALNCGLFFYQGGGFGGGFGGFGGGGFGGGGFGGGGFGGGGGGIGGFYSAPNPAPALSSAPEISVPPVQPLQFGGGGFGGGGFGGGGFGGGGFGGGGFGAGGVAPPSSGNVPPVAKPNLLMIRATPELVARIKEAIAKVDRPPRQVEVSFSLYSIDKSATRNFGLAAQPLTQGIADRFRFQFGATAGFAMSIVGKNQATQLQDFTTALDALVQQNRAKVLTSPRFVAVDGTLATISTQRVTPIIYTVVTYVFVPGQGFTPVQSTAILQIQTGVTFSAVSNVDFEGNTCLVMFPSFSEIKGFVTGPGGSPQVPITETSTINTIVCLRDGDTLLIGGITRESLQRQHGKFPLLGDLPVIGRLFSRVETQKTEQELLLMVTIRVVPSR